MTIKRPDHALRGKAKEVQASADLLSSDGHHDLATTYSAQAADLRLRAHQQEDAADALHELGTGIARICRELADDLPEDSNVGIDRSSERGEALADWLTDHGWTPPHPLEVDESAPDERTTSFAGAPVRSIPRSRL